MSQEELLEDILEQIKDAINVLQLLVEELTVNQEDTHILRSVGIAEKILQSSLSTIQQIKGD